MISFVGKSPALLATPERVHRAITSLTLAAILALIAGCSTTPKVRTEFEPKTNFGMYRTFAVLPISKASVPGDPGAALRLAKPVEEEAIATLVAAGFQPAEPGKADFSVALRGESIPKIEVADWGYTPIPGGRYGYHPGFREVEVDQYEERTLIAEVYDNQSKQLVWVGWAKRRASSEITVERARTAVRTVLSAFPPGSPAATP